MQYALLFYNPPLSELPEPERETRVSTMLAAMREWHEELTRAGVFRSMLRLAPVESATSLRGQAGKVLVHDGPFAETKEILGGLALLECADLDEALRWARRCPLVQIGTVEVRPEWNAARA
ncbi:MAG TPA: YciI family protein [Myxococcota bacterium]|nr:YciI family protein [Myxococcota bacterium]